jgi:hypothetical protein
MIVALSWIFSVYVMQEKISFWYARSSAALVDQLPIVTVKSGKISTPENRPYVVVVPETKETLMVIDTSGRYKTLADADTDYLVTESSVITKDGDVTKVAQIPLSLNTTLIPVVINQHIKSWINYVWIFLLPLLTVVSFFWVVMKSLIYGVIGRIFSAITHSGLSLFQCMSLYCVAMTPSLIVWTLFYDFNILFPHRGLTLFVVALAYLFFAILMNKPGKEG